MTPSFVQSANVYSATGVSTLTCAFPSNITSGNRAIVAVGAVGPVDERAFSITDTAGHDYRLDTYGVQVGGYWVALFSAELTTSAADTVTLTINGGGSFVRLAIHEYAGLAGLDVASSAPGNSATLNSGTAQTCQADALIFGWMVSNAGVTTPGSGFTIRETVQSESTMDMIVSSAGEYAATAPTGSSQWVALMGAYAASATTATGGSNVDTPENHGAVRDGVTDDSQAIIDAITAVVTTGIASGSYYGEVEFTPGIYAVKGDLVSGGSTLGNAQIPLPFVPTTGRKFTLVLKGTDDASALPHWQQTAVQACGVVLRSYDDSPGDGTLGPASVVGGPTFDQIGGGAFSNMLLVVDGVSIVSPRDARHTAWDFQCLGQVHLKSISANAAITPGQFNGTIPIPSRGGAGIRMPIVLNNDNCECGTVSVEGYSVGFIPSEHTNVKGLRIIYCKSGIWMDFAYSDGAIIEYASIEACEFHIDASGVSSSHCRLDIKQLDVEDGITVAHINDPSNVLHGDISYQRNDTQGGTGTGANLIINGARHLRVINGFTAPGAITAPAVPATTVALVNPLDRDAAVSVTGGTVTDVSVDGVSQLSGSGLVMVSSGKSIAVTYSTAPTWAWTLL